MFLFIDYSDAQIKQRINSKMLYSSYLSALENYNLNYRYKMLWQKHNDGYKLLVKEHIKSHKRYYLGRESEESIKIKEDFTKAKIRAKEKLSNLKEKMKREEKLNKLDGVARVPNELISIFKKINELGLDNKVIAIGTNSLYVYEASAAIIIEQEHLSTRDIDLLNKKDKSISFIFNEVMTTRSAIEFLHSIDKTFEKNSSVPYRFINDDGIWVELINPISDSIKIESFKDNLFSDVIPLAMNGMQWLESSRLYKELIIGENGKCAFMTTIHPLEYAIYKNWLSKREDRDYEKHIRDLQQSKLVTKLIQEHIPRINIEDEIKQIKHFKKSVVECFINDIYKKI